MAPAVVLAGILKAATKGCELDDCAYKAAVLIYVEDALANVTNAYLAFSTVSDTVLYSERDFQERAAVFAETLQDVANLNANLTDYFVSWLGTLLPSPSGSWLVPSRALRAIIQLASSIHHPQGVFFLYFPCPPDGL